MIANYRGGIQYADFLERTIPWIYPVMFMRACSFSMTVLLPLLTPRAQLNYFLTTWITHESPTVWPSQSP
jgi:hypothetical protein